MAEVEALIRNLRSADDKEAEAAAAELAKLGRKAIPPLIASFHEADLESPWALEGAFEKIGPIAVPYLVRALESDCRSTRLVATRLLWEFEANAAPAVSVFMARLKDPDAETRHLCAHGLGRIGPPSRKSLSSLIEALDDECADVRSSSLYALSEIGVSEAEGLAAFKKAVVDPDSNVRGWAISCAEGLVADLASVLEDLIGLLDDAAIETFRQGRIYDLIESVGPRAKPAVPRLLAHMRDTKRLTNFRLYAARAVWKIDPALGPDINFLLELLPSNPESVSDIFYEMGPAAAPAVVGLVKLLNEHDDYDTKWAVVCALGAIGPAAEVAIPALIEALGHPSGRVASCAAKALEEIGSASMAPLIKTLTDPDPNAREYAADALALMGTEARAALPALEESLEDSSKKVRFWSAIAIASISKSPDAIPVLLQALVDSENGSLFGRVWDALETIAKCPDNGGWHFVLLRTIQRLPLPQPSKQKLTFRLFAKWARDHAP